MLIELSVANYRCFRERVTLSLEAEPRVGGDAGDERNVARTADGELLRVVGIYGANASGKSNLLRVFSALQSMVLYSAREWQGGVPLPAMPFRFDADSLLASSEFEVVFAHAGMQYRYGVAATLERVEREWLFARATDEDGEERYFERERDVYQTGPRWRRDASLEEKTRVDALHLSVAEAFNHPQAAAVFAWFRRLRFIDSLERPRGVYSHTAKLLRDESQGALIRALMRRLDLGIDDFQVVGNVELLDVNVVEATRRVVEEGQALPRVHAIRGGLAFDLHRDESAGTAKAFELAGPIVEALASGEVVVIDEFDTRLHTLLAKQIVELFQDPATNPHDAQLVFASHDTNLLTRTLLRPDQLWFVEKSRKTNASDLYSLAELQLDDASGARYEADYLQGRYGAIPFFGNLHAILGEALQKQASKKEG